MTSAWWKWSRWWDTILVSMATMWFFLSVVEVTSVLESSHQWDTALLSTVAILLFLSVADDTSLLKSLRQRDTPVLFNGSHRFLCDGYSRHKHIQIATPMRCYTALRWKVCLIINLLSIILAHWKYYTIEILQSSSSAPRPSYQSVIDGITTLDLLHHWDAMFLFTGTYNSPVAYCWWY